MLVPFIQEEESEHIIFSTVVSSYESILINTIEDTKLCRLCRKFNPGIFLSLMEFLKDADVNRMFENHLPELVSFK